MARNNKPKKNSGILQKVLGLLIIVCFGVSGFFAYNYFKDINTQLDNAEKSLVKANDAIKLKTDYRDTKVNVGTVIGKIRIDGITEDMPIIEGESLQQAMQYGVGHIESSPMPGEYKNTQPAFSAHRETFFKPLEQTKEGDVVVVSMPYGTFKYKITRSIIVKPNETDKVYTNDGIKTERIVLITCYPFNAFSNPDKRIVFFADLIQ